VDPVKCSYGGCQTDAVVTVTPLSMTMAGDYEPVGDCRYACRFHMAVICNPDPLTGFADHLVQPLPW
jgi:hypothetical protein